MGYIGCGLQTLENGRNCSRVMIVQRDRLFSGGPVQCTRRIYRYMSQWQGTYARRGGMHADCTEMVPAKNMALGML